MFQVNQTDVGQPACCPAACQKVSTTPVIEISVGDSMVVAKQEYMLGKTSSIKDLSLIHI